MSQIDAVAEALARIDGWSTLAESNPTDISWYRRMAQTAVYTLGLTEEHKYLEDGSGGMSIDWKTGKTTSHMKAATRVTRLVTQWVVDS